MAMSLREQFTTKTALEVLEQSGAQGCQEDTLFTLVELKIDSILSSIEKRALLKTLLEKQWVYTYNDPITGNKRFAITEDGSLAAHAL